MATYLLRWEPASLATMSAGDRERCVVLKPEKRERQAAAADWDCEVARSRGQEVG